MYSGTSGRFTANRQALLGSSYGVAGGIARRAASQAAARQRARDAALIARSGAIAAVPASLAGTYRRAGFYGRYGRQALMLGNTPELKFFDTALNFNFDLTGEVPATGQLALIPQGDTESTRDGRLAWIKSIQIRGQALFAPSTGAQAAEVAYLYLVLDTQANGAAAAITDVFTSNVMSTNLLNLNNSGRFRIMKKWIISFNSGAGVTTAYNNVVQQIEFYKKCNIKMDWSSTTGAITEIRSNNIFLCAGAAPSDDLISFTGTCRLRFQG